MNLFFFGSFNPISIAHYNLAKFALKKTKSNKVIFVPCSNKYLLDNKNDIYSPSIRLELINLVKVNNPWMEVSDIEINANEEIRTYNSLLKLKELGYSGKLLLGADNLKLLETKWKYVENICKEFGIVCLERNNSNIKKYIKNDKYLNSLSKYIKVINGPKEMQKISSTQIRDYLKKKDFEKVKEYLPIEVYNYFRSRDE